jgi:hypothetical protein
VHFTLISFQETPREIILNGLIPNALYAFQICAVYDRSGETYLPWDTAPKYIVDLSAATEVDIEQPTSTTASIDGLSLEDNSFDTKQSKEKSDQEQEMGVLEIDVPWQPPQILNIDVKPVLITDESKFSSWRLLWLFLAVALLSITVFGFVLFLTKRSRSRRRLWQKQQIQIPSHPICYTQTSSAPMELKIPIE